MNIMNMDSVNIAGGLIILVTGLIAVLVSIWSRKSKSVKKRNASSANSSSALKISDFHNY